MAITPNRPFVSISPHLFNPALYTSAFFLVFFPPVHLCRLISPSSCSLVHPVLFPYILNHSVYLHIIFFPPPNLQYQTPATVRWGEGVSQSQLTHNLVSGLESQICHWAVPASFNSRKFHLRTACVLVHRGLPHHTHWVDFYEQEPDLGTVVVGPWCAAVGVVIGSSPLAHIPRFLEAASGSRSLSILFFAGPAM